MMFGVIWKTPLGFAGSWFSLDWNSGFGILKQNRGEIRDWKYARKRGRWDAKNKPWDYGIRGGKDYGIEERYWGPSNFTFQKIIDNAIEPRWLNYLSPISVGLAPEVPVLEFLTNSTKFHSFSLIKQYSFTPITRIIVFVTY